jgi:hypothetical protein
MISLLVIFGLLAVGMLLVAYGTIAKNRWGINLDPVSCPRCKSPLPRLREPQSFQQKAWGGWTCPVCGAGVDKWGREIEPVATRTIVKSDAEMRRLIKRKIILSTPVSFCLLLLLDWIGVTGRGFPSTWGEALIQVSANIIWTVFLTAISYFALSKYLDATTTEKRDATDSSSKSL